MLKVVRNVMPLNKAYKEAKTFADLDNIISAFIIGPMPLRIIEAFNRLSYQSN